jgi:hypothetical protein
MIKLISGIGFCTIVLFMGALANARVSLKSDLAIWPEFDHIEITIDRDGRYTYTQEYQFEVLNDRGRESESVQTIPYDARASSLKLIAARITTGHETLDVDEKNIETRETGQTPKAFDSQKQLVISYPNVHIGSHIYVKYKLDFKEVPFTGQWGWSMHYSDVVLQDMQVHIHSKIALKAFKQDIDSVLAIEESNGGKEIYIHNLKPLVQAVSQEDFPYIDPTRALAVVVSSETDWKKFAATAVADYENLLKAPLPRGLAKIRAEIGDLKAQATADETLTAINKVSALMAERYRYFGDWRRRNGGQIPRTLEEIDETSYGDCKDLALAATAIYRSLGLKADVAWIFRGESPSIPALYHFPVEGAFNHAIVRVSLEGKTYWVDATNPVAFAQGIPQDIADRPAFVVDGSGAFLDRTPVLLATDNSYSSNFSYLLSKDKSVEVSGVLNFKGRTATNLIIRNFYDSAETVNYDLIRSITGADRVLSFEVGDYDRKSRFVRDLEIKVTYKLADIGLRTTAGYGLTLGRSDVIDRLLVDPAERESDVYLTPPSITSQKILIRGVQKVGAVSMDCDLQNKWVHLQRRVRGSRTGVEVQDQYEVKNDRLLKSDLITPEFAKFQSRVRDCFFNSALILK